MAKFIYLGKGVRNQNLIHEKTKSRLNSGNVSYHLVHLVSRIEEGFEQFNLPMRMFTY